MSDTSILVLVRVTHKDNLVEHRQAHTPAEYLRMKEAAEAQGSKVEKVLTTLEEVFSVLKLREEIAFEQQAIWGDV